MIPKARPLRKNRPTLTISVDALFKAAFNQSDFAYQRESLLGWRPLAKEPKPKTQRKKQSPPKGDGPQFNNSPDVKVRETSDTIYIEVELPDIDEESLYLEVSGDLLIIRAQKTINDPSERTAPDKPPLIHRYVKLPVEAQPGNVQARLNGKMLRIKIGKPAGKM